ncbi:MAG: hypothetical protein IJ882_03945 [Paludibacteraceae bacterium]|nr:hypothetical protein [Paludibacteraceae bacterium]
MANCLFPAGIANVTGTLTKTTIVTSKGVITKRVVAQVRNGKQKLYIREDKPRRSKPTNKELAARASFALMAQEVTRRMANGDKRPRKLIWAEVKAELKKGTAPCK